jgi:hypothetical protein
MPSQRFPTDPPLSSRISALSDSLIFTCNRHGLLLFRETGTCERRPPPFAGGKVRTGGRGRFWEAMRLSLIAHRATFDMMRARQPGLPPKSATSLLEWPGAIPTSLSLACATSRSLEARCRRLYVPSRCSPGLLITDHQEVISVARLRYSRF